MLEESVALLDWRRQVFGIYACVRAESDPRRGWDHWVGERDRLFAEHSQTPLGDASQEAFTGLSYYAYDPAARVIGALEHETGRLEQVETSGPAPIGFYRIGHVRFTLAGDELALPLYWLDAYGGGLFLPFADATSGAETYGGGRYLLDTVKGADLGSTSDSLTLDFNFAYNPSCSYDGRWSCPLAPRDSRLAVAVRAGEQHRGG